MDVQEYDATFLVSKYKNVAATILIDQVIYVIYHKFEELEMGIPYILHLLSWYCDQLLFKFLRFVQGDEDKFLSEQLQPQNFKEACRNGNVPVLLRMQPGYDHSYHFIATFIDDHIRHHAQALNL